jgi:hypothetical protein
MKKLVLSVFAVAAATVALNAQGLVSKKGEMMLPEAGDMAISIDAVPVLNLLKFDDSGATVSAQPLNYTFTFKKFKSATEACRMGLTLGLNQFTELDEVAELNDGVADGDNTVTNKEKTRNTNIQVFIGHEHRRGNTRVQGFCGADVYTGIGSNSTVNSFGNDDSDLAATTYDLKNKSGLAFNIGARAFVGAEYFIAPKLALGFEAGLALGYESQAAGEIEQLTVTRVGGTTNTETNTIEGTSSTRDFGVNSNLTGGRVSLTFHF